MVNKFSLLGFPRSSNPTNFIFIALSRTSLLWVTKCGIPKTDWSAPSILVERSWSIIHAALFWLLRYPKRFNMNIARCCNSRIRKNVECTCLRTGLSNDITIPSHPKHPKTCLQFCALNYCNMIFVHVISNKMTVTYCHKGDGSLVEIFGKPHFDEAKKRKLILIEHITAHMFCGSFKRNHLWTDSTGAEYMLTRWRCFWWKCQLFRPGLKCICCRLTNVFLQIKSEPKSYRMEVKTYFLKVKKRHAQLSPFWIKLCDDLSETLPFFAAVWNVVMLGYIRFGFLASCNKK